MCGDCKRCRGKKGKQVACRKGYYAISAGTTFGVAARSYAMDHERESKTITLSTVIMLATGFDMTLIEFFDDELFSYENLEVE